MLRRLLLACLVLGALALSPTTAPAEAATSVTITPLSAADTFTYPFDFGIDRTFTVTNTGDTTQVFLLASRIVNDAGNSNGIILQTPFGGPRSLELAPGDSKILRLQLSWPEVATTAWLTGQQFEMPLTLELSVPGGPGPGGPVVVDTQTFANHVVVGLAPVDPAGMQTNATVAGTVRDADTGRPIPNASVQVGSAQGSARFTQTSSSGAYSVPAFAWHRDFLGTNIEYTVIVSAEGYAQQHRIVVPQSGATTTLDVSLRKPVTTGSYAIAGKYDTAMPVTYTDFSADGRYLATVPFHSNLDPD